MSQNADQEQNDNNDTNHEHNDNDNNNEKREQYRRNRDIAREIADTLGETEKKPRRQIMKIIERMGVDFAQDLLKQTQEIEANGGMMIATGERRRTPGGVFFFLARSQMPEDIKMEVFYAWRLAALRRKEREAQFPPFDWDERAASVEKIKSNTGEITDVKVNLVGRPGEIDRRQNLIVTTMTTQIPETYAFPAGVPEPPVRTMTYVVYISAKQWETVAKAIEKPDDELLVEGMCLFDPETDGVSVFTTYVSTKKLERRKQQQQQSKNEKGDKKKGKRNKQQQQQPQQQQGGGRPKEPVVEEAPVQEIDVDIPEGVPDEVAKKLRNLHKAAASFRQKISALESKPAGQQFGLDMTIKLLRSTEQQIKQLEDQYINK